MSSTIRIAALSLLVGAVVLGIKLLSWGLTGSVALLSDALESTVNLATALAALIAIRVAARPADANHPYGHHKAEYFSAVLEGVMIIVAALLILREAHAGFIDPRPLDAPVAGLALNGVATVINGLWATLLIRHGRRHRSPALVADGRHLLTDFWSSGGVILGVTLAAATGWWLLDPLIAALVALNILWSGSRVIRESLSGLMDEAAPPEILARIEAIIAEQASGAVQAHGLKTRHAGSAVFVEFHLVVPGEMTVSASHRICDRIEHAIEVAIPDAMVTIHVEPDEKVENSGIYPVGRA